MSDERTGAEPGDGSGVRCPNPECPSGTLRRRAETLAVSPDPGRAPTPWVGRRGYWLGVLTGAVLSLALLLFLVRWAVEIGQTSDEGLVLGWTLVVAWLVASLFTGVYEVRLFLKHYARGGRATRHHSACGRCGYRWQQLDLRPDVAAQEAAILRSSLTRWRRLGIQRATAYLLLRLGISLRYTGQWSEAPELLRESLPLLDAEADRPMRAYALAGLGYAALGERDWPRARSLFEEALEVAREHQDWVGIGHGLGGVGTALLGQGAAEQAQAYFREGLPLVHRSGDRQGVAWYLEGLAGVLAATRPLEAARLFGAAEALRAAVGIPRPPDGLPCYEQSLAVLRQRLDETRLAAAWAQGRAMPMDQVLALAGLG